MDLLTQSQFWYLVVAILWSIFQGIRGVVETRLASPVARQWRPWERMVVLYLHDFVYRFVCTMAGFVSLYMSLLLFNEIAPDREMTTGDALMLVVLFLVGVVGVGGQLHYVMLLGKWPAVRS